MEISSNVCGLLRIYELEIIIARLAKKSAFSLEILITIIFQAIKKSSAKVSWQRNSLSNLEEIRFLKCRWLRLKNTNLFFYWIGIGAFSRHSMKYQLLSIYSLIQMSWSNFDLRAPDAYLAPSYLIATAAKCQLISKGNFGGFNSSKKTNLKTIVFPYTTGAVIN